MSQYLQRKSKAEIEKVRKIGKNIQLKDNERNHLKSELKKRRDNQKVEKTTLATHRSKEKNSKTAGTNETQIFFTKN